MALGLLAFLAAHVSAQTPARDVSTSVMGGANAPAGQYRAVGALVQVDPKRKPRDYALDSLYAFCSATLITPDVILTAAHCLRVGKPLRNPTVVFDKENLSDKDPGERRRVESIAVNPAYSDKGHSGDIGLAFLSRPVTSIAPLPIPIPGIDPEPRFLDVVAAAGWGRWTSKGLEGAFGLKGPLKIAWGRAAGSAACKKKNPFFQDDHLCMTGVKRWGSLCYGDSGGPLALLDSSGTEPSRRTRLLPPQRLVGVNSAVLYGRKGRGCTQKAIDVFESMAPSSTNNHWVREILAGHGIDPDLRPGR